MTGEKCGTYAGYNLHRRRKESVCDSCKKAQADYIAAWRRRTKAPRETQQKEARRAQWRAISRLIEAHREEYDALRAEEGALSS